jgi:hypothetical protein
MEETQRHASTILRRFFFDNGDAKSVATNETDTHLLLIAKELYIEDAEVKHKDSRRFKKATYQTLIAGMILPD